MLSCRNYWYHIMCDYVCLYVLVNGLYSRASGINILMSFVMKLNFLRIP